MSYVELSIQVPPETLDTACAFLHELGTGGLVVDDEAGGRVRVWLPRDARLDVRLAELQAGLEALAAGAWDLGTRAVDPEDWANAWKRFWHVSRVGRVVIAPSWEPHTAQADDVVIQLDPGMAFGTGTHASTALCLRRLQERVRPGCTLADLGTGSGILAVAAALLGAARVWAADIDPVAVRAARENVDRNGVGERVTVLAGGPEALPQACDILVANLTADLHLALAPQEAALVAPGGVMILSGIVAAEAERVAATLRGLGMAASRPDILDGWACISACRVSPA